MTCVRETDSILAYQKIDEDIKKIHLEFVSFMHVALVYNLNLPPIFELYGFKEQYLSYNIPILYQTLRVLFLFMLLGHNLSGRHWHIVLLAI